MASVTDSTALYPAEVNTAWCRYASVNTSYPLTNPVGKDSSNTTYSQWNLTTGSSAESYVFYKFDCSSIPSNATIKKVECSTKAYCSNTNSSRVATRTVQLYNGTTKAMGSATTVGAANSVTMTCGTWTRTQLNDCYIRIYAKRGTSNTTTTYYMRFYGATLTITYEYNKVEYTITTSLTGAGTIKPSGSSSVESGKGFSLNIIPSSPSSTIRVRDNGTDVSSLLEDASGGTEYSVKTKSGASYGFQQNFDEHCKPDWWQSTNAAKSSSASVCTVGFTCSRITNVKVRFICYAEATYDYMCIGPMDGSLSTSASADNNAVYTNKNSNSANEQSYTFSNVAAGTHTFDIKYFKDSYTDSNWDSAQFIIELEPENVVGEGKVYNISNVSENHTITVEIIGSSVGVYVKRDNVWVECGAVYKKGSSWTVGSKSDIDNTKKYKKITV